MRMFLTAFLLIGGFALQAVSYFLLASPLGIPSSPAHSEPRMVFAPGLFVLGVMMVFIAAVVYELLPSERR